MQQPQHFQQPRQQLQPHPFHQHSQQQQQPPQQQQIHQPQQLQNQPHQQQVPPQHFQPQAQSPANIQMQQFRQQAGQQRQPSPQPMGNFLNQQPQRPNPMPFQLPGQTNFQSSQPAQPQQRMPHQIGVPHPVSTQAAPSGIIRNPTYGSQNSLSSTDVRPASAPAPILDHMSSFFQNSPSSFNQSSTQPRTPQPNTYPGNTTPLTPGNYQQTPPPQGFIPRSNFNGNQQTPPVQQTFPNYGSPRVPLHQSQSRPQQPPNPLQSAPPRPFLGGNW